MKRVERVFRMFFFVATILFTPSARADSDLVWGGGVGMHEIAVHAGVSWGRDNQLMLTVFGEGAAWVSTGAPRLSLNMELEGTLAKMLVISASGGMGEARDEGAWNGFGTLTLSVMGVAPISPALTCRAVFFPTLFSPQSRRQTEIWPMMGARIRLKRMSDVIVGPLLGIHVWDEGFRLSPGWTVAFRAPL